MNKIKEIEILRAFAILGVVFIHTNDAIPWEINIFLIGSVRSFVMSGIAQDILRCAIPLFVLISGFVLGLRYRHDFSIISFYRKRAISIIPQYLIFSSMYFFFLPYSITLSELLRRLLVGFATPAFWFFILIIYLYIIYPLLIKLIDRSQFKYKWFLLFTCIFLIYFCWELFKFDVKDLITTDSSFINEIIGSTFRLNLFYHLIFFALGVYISNNVDRMTIKLKELQYFYKFSFIILLFAAFYILRTYYDISPVYVVIKNRFLKPFLHISYIYFFYRAAILLMDNTKRLREIFTIIGRYSFGIFLIHMFILFKVKEALHWFDEAFIFKKGFYLSAFALTILLSIVSLKLISFIRYSEFAIGFGIKRK